MRADANALGNMMTRILFAALDGDITSTRYGAIDMQDFNEADIALAISRQLAMKKKRIILNIDYPKKAQSAQAAE